MGSKPPSSTFIRMASRLPILLLLCLIPLLASALGEEEERSHEVQASSAELQASVVKREAKECKGKDCKRKKKNGKAKNGKKRKASRRKTVQQRKKNNKKKQGKKTKSDRKKAKKGLKNKNKNKNKENKPKEGKKLKEKKFSGKNSGEGRQITGNAPSCAMKAIKYARIFEGKATSIFRQVKRVKGNDKIQGSKGKKKGDFNATMDRLVTALGGDIDNPKCDGTPIKDGSSSANATFRNGTTAKSTIDTLRKCEKDIEEKCANAVTGNATKLAELEACFKVADDFKTSFGKCLDKKLSIDDQCKCVEEISDPEAELQKCNTKSDNDKALELKKACKQAVGTCKQAEAKAAEGIDSCKERTKCDGV